MQLAMQKVFLYPSLVPVKRDFVAMAKLTLSCLLHDCAPTSLSLFLSVSTGQPHLEIPFMPGPASCFNHLVPFL